MECPRCQTVNRDERRFCALCGSALPAACAACGFPNQPAENFCGGCGRRLGTEPERRQLTVMFCDLVDSTELVN